MSKKNRHVSNKKGQKPKLIGQENALLRFYFENPNLKLTVRELAQKTKLSRSTVQYYLARLKNSGYLTADNRWNDSWVNRLKKTNYYVEKIAESGLVDYLDRELAASAIVLFGSFRKGESIKSSDIDIFVECAHEKNLDLSPFERELGHKVQLFTRVKITKLPNNLLNNVINGIKLKGHFIIK